MRPVNKPLTPADITRQSRDQQRLLTARQIRPVLLRRNFAGRRKETDEQDFHLSICFIPFARVAVRPSLPV